MKKRSFFIAAAILVLIGGSMAVYDRVHDSVNTSTDTVVPKSQKGAGKKSVPKTKSANPKILAGYVQDFRDPEKINMAYYTHIIFSFAHPTADGDVLLNGDRALEHLRKIVSEANQQGTKVILAVGGWYHIHGGESYPYFKKAISSPGSRKRLASELTMLVRKEKLDGIDIDFEHPRTKEDAANLAAFARDLSVMLRPAGKELSIAVNAKINSISGMENDSVVFEPGMFEYFERVHLMAYDGQWDGGYNAANLSTISYSQNIINYWTRLFDRHGYSREKLILGVPLYGQPEDPGAKQVSYEALMKNNPGNIVKDSVTLNGMTYHYNGHSTLKKKTTLAIDQQLGGMMIWEAGLDAKDHSSAANVIGQTLVNQNYVFR